MRTKIAVVTGSANGLGKEIVQALRHNYEVVGLDLEDGFDVANPNPNFLPMEIDVLVNCAGVNRINWLRDVEDEDWDAMLNTNTKGIFKMAQLCEDRLRKRGGTILNIVSNAAHMPMRCSAAYNASKGAALILTKQLARELSPDITVFSVSPNRLAGTGMSKAIDEQVIKTRGWTLEEAQKYQRAGLLAGEETKPERVAEFIGFLLSMKERHKYLTGCDIPYGA
jgi:NAD(P)-dependent dehydrogenase (short-subunit alcohol dehydrogenase family)